MNPDSARRAPRLRDRLRQATVGAILDAAEQTFAAEGPRARMESIAARAGIAVGTLYNHFADRDALWAELSRSRREALLVRLDEALEETAGGPFERGLRAFLDAFLAHWAAHRGFLALLMAVEPIGARSPRSPGTMLGELLARASSLVARGAAEGALRRDADELHAALLLGMIRTVLFQHPHGTSMDGAAGDVARLVDLFLHGAAGPSPARAAPEGRA